MKNRMGFKRFTDLEIKTDQIKSWQINVTLSEGAKQK